jgi:hypothetical protein
MTLGNHALGSAALGSTTGSAATTATLIAVELTGIIHDSGLLLFELPPDVVIKIANTTGRELSFWISSLL